MCSLSLHWWVCIVLKSVKKIIIVILIDSVIFPSTNLCCKRKIPKKISYALSMMCYLIFTKKNNNNEAGTIISLSVRKLKPRKTGYLSVSHG